MAYDYNEAVKADVKAWLADNFEFLEDSVDDTADRDAVKEFMYDELFAEDDVTGNGSLGYAYGKNFDYKVAVMANLNLAVDALDSFGEVEKLGQCIKEEDYRFLDVTIRCYLLGDAIDAVIDEAEALRGE